MPYITESDLKKHIKNKSFSPVYAIFGDEQMYVKNYTSMLIDAVAGKEPSDFNYHEFKGEINIDELAAALQLVPFMSEYNCVLLEDPAIDFMKDAELKKFKEVCKIRSEGTVFIISVPSGVPQKRKSFFESLLKIADKNGSVCEFKKQPANTLEKFIVKWANENGKKISRVNADKLIQFVGEDLNTLKNEVDKISAYSSGEEITYEDIVKLATVKLENKVFDLSDAVINCNGERAYMVLDTLINQNEDPIGLLYILSMAYIDAYRMRAAEGAGINQAQVAKDFEYKGRAFVLGRAARSTSRVETEALRKSIAVLTDAEMTFKSVKVNPRLHLEQVIAQLLMVAREGRR